MIGKMSVVGEIQAHIRCEALFTDGSEKLATRNFVKFVLDFY
jgi:hypothetical protein